MPDPSPERDPQAPATGARDPQGTDREAPAHGERDPIDAVRAHLDDAHAAAERLVQEAQRQAEEAAAQEVPPRGWESTQRSGPAPGATDLHTLVALIDALRRAVPPDLSRQLAEAVRDLLIAVRAVIDWYLEKLDGDRGPSGPEVEDIPLD